VILFLFKLVLRKSCLCLSFESAALNRPLPQAVLTLYSCGRNSFACRLVRQVCRCTRTQCKLIRRACRRSRTQCRWTLQACRRVRRACKSSLSACRCSLRECRRTGTACRPAEAVYFFLFKIKLTKSLNKFVSFSILFNSSVASA